MPLLYCAGVVLSAGEKCVGSEGSRHGGGLARLGAPFGPALAAESGNSYVNGHLTSAFGPQSTACGSLTSAPKNRNPH